MINVGLIGLGFMGRVHYSCYTNLSNAKVVSICDADIENLKGSKNVQGNINAGGGAIDFSNIRTTTNADEIFHSADIQVVDLSVPTFLHCKYAIKAAEAGKHVFCEKPMARNIKEAQKMIDACKANNVHLMIGQVLRFWPEYIFLKESIQSNAYGKLLSVVFTRLSPTPTWSWKNWILNPKLGGEAIIDLHIHDVDTTLWLLGRPSLVFAQGKAKQKAGTGISYVVSIYYYENGPVCTLEGGWIMEGGHPFTMGFLATFENAVISYNNNHKPTLCVYEKDKQISHPQIQTADPYRKEIEYFLNCIETNSPVENVPPETSLEAVRFVHYEKSSIKKGKVIKLT